MVDTMARNPTSSQGEDATCTTQVLQRGFLQGGGQVRVTLPAGNPWPLPAIEVTEVGEIRKADIDGDWKQLPWTITISIWELLFLFGSLMP